MVAGWALIRVVEDVSARVLAGWSPGLVASGVVSGRVEAGSAGRVVVARAGRGSDAEQGEPLVGGGEVVGPGPVIGQPERHSSGAAHEAAGCVQEPVTQGAWFGGGEVAGEADQLAPGEQVGCGEDELEPGLVRGERGERHAFETAVFEVADAVLDLGVTAVPGLEFNEVAGRVGEHDLVAEPVVIPQSQLGAGVRGFAATDRPGACGPTGHGDVEFGDLGVVASLPVAVDRRHP